MSGLYAADGGFNVSVVDGTTIKGVYAANGSLNVIQSLGTSPTGFYHKSGSTYVTVAIADKLSATAADGSKLVSVSPYKKGTQKVTVVAGAFT